MRRLVTLSTLIALLAVTSGAAHDERIFVLGDSNATGVGVEAHEAWPMRLMRMSNRTVQVFGAPMAVLAGIAKVPSAFGFVQGHGLGYAVLALGTNDVARGIPLEEVRKGTTTLVSSVQARWVCITPPTMVNEKTQPNAIGEYAASYRRVIAEACIAAGATVIHGDEIISEGLLADTVHLNARGHIRMARAVAAALGVSRPLEEHRSPGSH